MENGTGADQIYTFTDFPTIGSGWLHRKAGVASLLVRSIMSNAKRRLDVVTLG